MKITLYNSWQDPTPHPWECSWEEWRDFVEHQGVRRLDSPPPGLDPKKRDKWVTEQKKKTPAFSPAELKPGATRGNAGVAQLWLGCLDYDEGVTDDVLEAIEAKLQGRQAWFYTSSQHTPESPRFRIVLPLDRPVAPHEWKRFWRALVSDWPGTLDVNCKDLSRIYGLPAAFDVDEAFSAWYDGEPLSVDATLQRAGDGFLSSLPPLSAVHPLPDDLGFSQPLNPSDLKAVEAKWRRRGDERSLLLARALGNVRKGECYAGDGSRNTGRTILTNALEAHFPATKIADLAALFEDSHRAMYQESELEAENRSCYQQFESARRKRIAAGQHKAALEENRHDIRVRRTAGRPYTYQDIEEFAEQLGVTPAEFQLMWVLQHKGSFFFWTPQGYRGAYPKDAAQHASLTHLAPAAQSDEVPLQLIQTTNLGPRLKTPLELCQDYGTLIDAVEYSHHEDTHIRVGSTNVLSLRKAWLREATPRFDPRMDEWLHLLAGDQYENLIRWCYLARDVGRPLAALYLHGQGGAGKSAFAEFVAYMWGVPPVTSKKGTDKFNMQLVGHPVLFADESLPKEWRGPEGLEEFRHAVARDSWDVEDKYIPSVRLVSPIRIILASNNDHLLSVGKDLEEDDRDAIKQRIFDVFVDRDQDAKKYLEEWWQHTPEIRDAARDAFPGHILACVEARPELGERRGRFGIPPMDSTVSDALIFNDYSNAAVADWLLGFLHDPQAWFRLSNNTPRCKAALKRGGQLLINVMAMNTTEDWQAYCQVAKLPASARLARSLSEWSSDKAHIDGMVFHEIDLNLLGRYAQYTDKGDVETLRARVATLDLPATTQSEKVKVVTTG